MRQIVRTTPIKAKSMMDENECNECAKNKIITTRGEAISPIEFVCNAKQLNGVNIEQTQKMISNRFCSARDIEIAKMNGVSELSRLCYDAYTVLADNATSEIANTALHLFWSLCSDLYNLRDFENLKFIVDHIPIVQAVSDVMFNRDNPYYRNVRFQVTDYCRKYYHMKVRNTSEEVINQYRINMAVGIVNIINYSISSAIAEQVSMYLYKSYYSSYDLELVNRILSTEELFTAAKLIEHPEDLSLHPVLPAIYSVIIGYFDKISFGICNFLTPTVAEILKSLDNQDIAKADRECLNSRGRRSKFDYEDDEYDD